jgi:YbbR domain-containing protein
VRPDLEGDPAEGFVLGEVEVEPSTVRITGARSEVLRLSEVLTETIDVTGVEVSVERTVKPSIRGRHVWLEESQEITVRVVVESLEKEPG